MAELGDAELAAYVAAAREAGEEGAARLGLRIFAFGMQDRVLSFVRCRLKGRAELEIEEVAARTLEDALRSIEALDGRSDAEARAFVFRIARRRLADFHRASRLAEEPLELDLGSGEQLNPAVADRADGTEADAIDTLLVIDECLGQLRPDHRAVVELCLVQGYSAREAVERVGGRVSNPDDDPLSEQNAHQIVSRFRRNLRQRLDGATTNGPR